MKKIVSVILCALMLFGVSSLAFAAGAAEGIAFGDVDKNGSITAADARIVLRASVGLEKLSSEQLKRGDADRNGKISAADARLILRASVGLENLNIDPSGEYVPFYNDLICDFRRIVEYNGSFDGILSVPGLSSTFMNMQNRDKLSYELDCMAIEIVIWNDSPASAFGYILYDMNNDGIPELFWMRRSPAEIIAVFTFKNNSAVLLNAFWSRHRGFIREGGKLHTHGSSGAAYSHFSIFELNSYGLEEIYKLDSVYNEYTDSIDRLEYSLSGTKKLSDSEFYARLREYPSECAAFWYKLPVMELDNLIPVAANMPETTEEICEFYKNATSAVRAGKAGYTFRGWAYTKDIDTGDEDYDRQFLEQYGDSQLAKDQAEEYRCSKGSTDAMYGFFEWTLADLSAVKSAKCEASGDNYIITITMKDVENPIRNYTVLDNVTLIPYDRDLIKENFDNSYDARSYGAINIKYDGFKIVAEMTPDGKFVSLQHIFDIKLNVDDVVFYGSQDLYYFYYNNMYYYDYYNFVY